MHRTIAHRAFSLLMTFAMILTCNCATLQPIVAYAADDALRAAGPVAPGDVDAPQGADSGNHGGDVGGDLEIGDGAGPLGGGEAGVGKAANLSESTDASNAAGGDVGAGASTLSKKAGRAGGGGELSLTVNYEKGDGDAYSTALRSYFRLYVYPNGFADSEKLPVAVSMADVEGFGPYSYDGTSSQPTEMKEGIIGNDKGGGALVVGGLPEGCYGLEETSSSPGYAAYEGLKCFSVENDAGAWSVNYRPTGTDRDLGASSITNAKTRLVVKKTSPQGTDSAGAVLSVYKANSDGSQSDEKATSLFGEGEFTVTVGAGSEYRWDVTGIGASSYYLVEDAAPTDTRLGKFEGVKFAVDTHGKVTILSGPAKLDGATNTLAIEADPVQTAVLSLDQHARGVAGATLQAQQLDGSTWTPVGDAWTPTTEDEAKAGHVFAGLQREKTFRIVQTVIPGGYVQANHGTDGGNQQMVEFAFDEYGDIEAVDLHHGDVPTDNLDWGSFRNAFDKVFTVRSERIVGQAEFTVYDATIETGVMKPLAGVQFDLYRKGTAVGGGDELVNEDKHFTSDADGKVTTATTLIDNVLAGEVMKHGLTPGTYYFKQVAAPADFVYDAADPVKTDPFVIGKDQNRFTWMDGGAFGGTVQVTVDGGANAMVTPLNAAIHLCKVDGETGAGVIGATFALQRGDGTVVDSQRTAAAGSEFGKVDSNGNKHVKQVVRDGELYFVNVPAGTYTVTETAPASGYQPNGVSFEVVVSQDEANRVYAVGDGGVVTNVRTPAPVEKTNDAKPLLRTGDPLAGGIFALGGIAFVGGCMVAAAMHARRRRNGR